MGPVMDPRQVAEATDIPFRWDNSQLGLPISRPHFHDAPIFARCLSTREASVATSSVSSGKGMA
jgi:hypothetical protein